MPKAEQEGEGRGGGGWSKKESKALLDQELRESQVESEDSFIQERAGEETCGAVDWAHEGGTVVHAMGSNLLVWTLFSH